MSDALRHSLQTSLGSAYTITRELGGGGMARVFVARDETLGRDVVVKVLAPEPTQELSVDRRDVLLAENFLDPLFDPLRGDARYARVVARLGARASPIT